MYKLGLILITVLPGCVAAPTGPAATAQNVSGPELVSSVPVTEIDMADLKGDTRHCENLTHPGSRIVVAQRCSPIDEESLEDQLHQVRRDQDELDRLAREREAQRRGGRF